MSQEVHDFKQYLETTKLTFSYKLVLVHVLLSSVDEHGHMRQGDLISAFRAFYIERERAGLPTERERERHPSPMQTPHEASDETVWQILARHPLPLMERFVFADAGAGVVGFKPRLWDAMHARDVAVLRAIVQKRLADYYTA